MREEGRGDGKAVIFNAKKNIYNIHMWQSHVEIEDYFVAYFDRIAAFKVPYR